MQKAKNVLGGDLDICCGAPMTGFYRDGTCNTGSQDAGAHVVCAEVTAEFLAFTQAQGNDLRTPSPGFLGLQPGDRWCLCAARWQEALEVGAAPPVILESTHVAALQYIRLEELKAHAHLL